RTGLEFGAAPLDCSAPAPAAFATAVQAADLLAKRAAQSWSAQDTRDVLRRLARTGGDFLEPGADRLTLAFRAERLVLALDRLLSALPADERPPGSSELLSGLFRLAQSQPDFAPDAFVRELGAFDRSLGRAGQGAPSVP
ncbi:MAG TPA: hypothetical protein VN877_07420, partial [Opitutaceae bacterium]|nr:hypothetical protein [Opitutaceae bacterium]